MTVRVDKSVRDDKGMMSHAKKVLRLVTHPGIAKLGHISQMENRNDIHRAMADFEPRGIENDL